MDLDGKSILITGGTGSFGKAFVRAVLEAHPEVRRLIVFSRDELKQFEMQQTLSPTEHPSLRYFIGDIRDRDRLYRALEGVDYVIHAAALKQVPAAEYNPFECIKTNVLGAQNLIEAALDRDVKAIVALSTDKAAAPVNLYGATKLCSDKLFTAASAMAGASDARFMVVRYGNVMGSRGSVIPFFLSRRDDGPLPITDPSMTRFNISLEEGVRLVLMALKEGVGGEIFVPKIPSYRILDVAEAIAPGRDVEIVGTRPGEKIHEEMITASDSFNTIDLGSHYVILPTTGGASGAANVDGRQGRPVEPGFAYNSGSNPHFLTVPELRELIEKHMGVSLS